MLLMATLSKGISTYSTPSSVSMRFVVLYMFSLTADMIRLPTHHTELSTSLAFGLIDITKATAQAISRTRYLESMKSTI